MGRDKQYPLSETQKANAEETVKRVNELLHDIGLPFYGISSGYRPSAINARVKGAATKSAHISCEAVDLRDSADQKIGRYLTANQDVLEKFDLYMENIGYTKGTNSPWVHLQTRKTRSGRRVFIP